MTLAAIPSVVALTPALLAGLSLLAIVFAGVIASLLVIATRIRREEAGADALAAAVFQEVLSETGVKRIRRDEGLGWRWCPTVARTHPHPAARRQAGLQRDADSARKGGHPSQRTPTGQLPEVPSGPAPGATHNKPKPTTQAHAS